MAEKSTLAYLNGIEVGPGSLYLGDKPTAINTFVEAGPQPVTDQIVLYLDASNPSSYAGTGAKWYDLSGNGQVASITGSLSYSSSSLVFPNNTSNYIYMPHNNVLNVFDGDFTIDHWITVDAFVTVAVNDVIGFFFKGSTNVEANPGFGARMDRNTNSANFGKGYFLGNNATTPTYGYFTEDNQNMVAKKWYNIQIVRSGSTVKLYSNGTEKQSGTNSNNYNNSQPLWWGKFNNASYGPWEGKIGTFLIYDKALSAAELQQNRDYYSTKFT